MIKQKKRFIQTYTESSVFQETSVWVDRETGVNYLWHTSGSGGGLTPLLDREGKPIITAVFEDEE